MSKNPKNALSDYLQNRARVQTAIEAAQTALDSLTPFESIDERRGYPLCNASALNVGELASAMWTAFGRPVSRCSFLHAKVPLIERPWAEDATRLGDLVLAKYSNQCEWLECDPKFLEAFAVTVGHRLHAALNVTLADSGELAGNFHPQRMLLTVLRIRTALYATQSPDAKNLDPLANILLQAIPVVGSTRKRGEWYVVVQ